MSFPFQRGRRLRYSPSIRHLVEETSLQTQHLICPLFVIEGTQTKQTISSMPAYFRFSLDLLISEVEKLVALGLRTFCLFPIIEPTLKANDGKEAYNPEGLVSKTIKRLKKEFPEICLISDIALDPYTKHGHDGLIDESGYVLNDPTLEILGKMALCHAEAGVDIVAPSDMMDGRIAYIRGQLEENNYPNTLILAYAAKFASSFYGPFREALGSNLQFGDKKTYQLNPANSKEAEREILLDLEEGADLIMVKPGLAYLDIIYRTRQITKSPIIAYSVSGEYAMFKAAAAQNWLDEKKIVMESLLAFRRAGAQAIITYYAAEAAKWLKEAF